MNLTSVKGRVMNFFLLSLLSFFVYLVAREFFPLAFPGAGERLLWLSLISGIFSAILYAPSIYLSIQKRMPGGKVVRSGDKSLKILGSETENAARIRLSWVFQAFLMSFLLIVLTRQYADFALFINSGYFLIAVVFFGGLSFAYPPGEDVFKIGLPVKKDYFLAAFLGITGSFLVWYKIQAMGPWGGVIAIISGLLIILLSILILEEE